MGVEKLTGDDLYRIRQGDHSIVYSISDAVLTVLVIRVGNRRDVYRQHPDRGSICITHRASAAAQAMWRASAASQPFPFDSAVISKRMLGSGTWKLCHCSRNALSKRLDVLTQTKSLGCVANPHNFDQPTRRGKVEGERSGTDGQARIYVDAVGFVAKKTHSEERPMSRS